ncbi:MAG: hypothetical protein WC868_11350 [Bacteroidales bacterium]
MTYLQRYKKYPTLTQTINNHQPKTLIGFANPASPYLADTVLISTFKRSNPLTPGHVKDVFVPNSPDKA